MARASVIGAEIRARISSVVSETMLRARVAVAEATPVDTHHAESNWVLSTGAPYTGVDGSREAVSYAAQEAGDEAMKRYDVGRDGAVYLRNNVPYVKYLDEGWSQQAPAGFVADAIRGAGDAAPHGSRGAVRKMLRGMARAAIVRRRVGRVAAIRRNEGR
jgi:hypothetical protein